MIAPWDQLGPPTLGAMLASSGRVSWSQFVRSFRESTAAQLDMLPSIGVGVLVLILVWINWRVAKRLSASMGQGRRAPAAEESASGDHASKHRAA
ncbi:MAG: hypothetical protein R3B49_02130 [Phycisphaerales bacterium]